MRLHLDVTVEPGQVEFVKVKADAGNWESRAPVLFEPDEECKWPVGLELIETTVTLPVGVVKNIRIPIYNNTTNRIDLPKNIYLGRITTLVSVVEYRTGEKETSVLQVCSQETTHEKWNTEQSHPEKINKILNQLKLDHLEKEQ